MQIQMISNNLQEKAPGLFSHKSWFISKPKINRGFIPFVQERDGLGRLLPPNHLTDSKSFTKNQLTISEAPKRKAKPKENQKPAKTRPISFNLKNQKAWPEASKPIQQENSLAKKYMFFETSDTNQKPIDTSDAKPLFKSMHQTQATKRSKPDTCQSGHRRIPNYSFSKSIKKTIIEETIEKSKKNDREFIDVSKAHFVIKRRNNYVPDYSKMAKSLNPDVPKKSLNHAYLMKILNFSEVEQSGGNLIRQCIFDNGQQSISAAAA